MNPVYGVLVSIFVWLVGGYLARNKHAKLTAVVTSCLYCGVLPLPVEFLVPFCLAHRAWAWAPTAPHRTILLTENVYETRHLTDIFGAVFFTIFVAAEVVYANSFESFTWVASPSSSGHTGTYAENGMLVVSICLLVLNSFTAMMAAVVESRWRLQLMDSLGGAVLGAYATLVRGFIYGKIYPVWGAYILYMLGILAQLHYQQGITRSAANPSGQLRHYFSNWGVTAYAVTSWAGAVIVGSLRASGADFTPVIYALHAVVWIAATVMRTLYVETADEQILAPPEIIVSSPYGAA